MSPSEKKNRIKGCIFAFCQCVTSKNQIFLIVMINAINKFAALVNYFKNNDL
jgi:hypothetical protein